MYLCFKAFRFMMFISCFALSVSCLLYLFAKLDDAPLPFVSVVQILTLAFYQQSYIYHLCHIMKIVYTIKLYFSMYG